MQIKKASYKKLYQKFSQLEHDKKKDHRIPIIVGRIRKLVKEGKEEPCYICKCTEGHEPWCSRGK